jgi:hypothetical protein
MLKDAHRSAHSHDSKNMKNGLKLIKIYYIQYMAYFGCRMIITALRESVWSVKWP